MVRQLDFFASLSINPSDILKIQSLLNRHQISSNPLDKVLITPMFSSPKSLDLVRTMKEKQGATVMFDSGGYYVQVGRLTYQALYYPLLKLYRDLTWADIYTLPDYVPTSQDAPDLVEHKVLQTAKFGRLFYQEMPASLKPKAMGVVHGHTQQQVEHCLKTYFDLGLTRIGFGSFGTVGKNSQVNVATGSAIDLARHVVQIADFHQVKVHFFGVGVPALVAMIYGSGAASFDSASWQKAAGFGQIFLPFTRAYNISHRNGSNDLQKGITLDGFNILRAKTEHDCPFCLCLDSLQAQKMYRAIHNLLCIKEAVAHINQGNYRLIEQIYRHGSPKYQQEYQKWLV